MGKAELVRTASVMAPRPPRRPLWHPLLLIGLAPLALGARAEGLQLPALKTDTLRWQARVQLSSLEEASGSRILGANLLGDYYLTGSLLGSQTRGGLRATGGLLMGAASLSQSSAGLALGGSSLARRQSLAVGQRSVGQFSLLPPQSADPGNSMSYLGIGYTGQSLRGGWGFSADLGLARMNYRDELRLGRGNGQSLDELLMDMRFRPVLQLGLNYSF